MQCMLHNKCPSNYRRSYWRDVLYWSPVRIETTVEMSPCVVNNSLAICLSVTRPMLTRSSTDASKDSLAEESVSEAGGALAAPTD